MPGSAEARTVALVNEYVRITNAAKFDEMAELFADDAVYLGPDGIVREGKQAIGAYYAAMDPELTAPLVPVRPTAIAITGDQALYAFDVKRGGEYVPCAVDQFTVDEDGKIAKFIVYLRPGPLSDELRAHHAAQAADTP